jgi:16S rRNA processing protein RimM
VITGAHGVRGLVRLRAFTERPEDVTAYGPLEDEAGDRRFAFELTGRSRGALLARVEGIGDRDQAQQLAGTRLYVARDRLPEIEEAETYYHADLIGLAAEDRDGRPLGRVMAIHDFGAGEVLELGGPEAAKRGGSGSLLVPFTRAAVPTVDLEGGRLVVDPPPEIGEPETGDPEPGDGDG